MTNQQTTKAVVPYLRTFNDEEKKLIDVLLAQVAPKANAEEKAMFLYHAQKKGLDPFTRQIYLVPRWDSKLSREVNTVQVSIDGLRLMAQRSGKYAGQTPYQWCGSDGKWVDVWLADEPPAAARVAVMRHDFIEPLYSVALFNSYKQTKSAKNGGGLTSFWERYGPHMLAKCAEALSIRRAFPEETSGFYIAEEMGNPEILEQMENAIESTLKYVDEQPQAAQNGDHSAQAEPAPVVTAPLSKEVRDKLYTRWVKLGNKQSAAAWLAYLIETLGREIKVPGDLTVDDGSRIALDLSKREAEAKQQPVAVGAGK